MNPQAEHNIFINRDRERIGALKHHANRFSQLDQRDIRVIDVFAKQINDAFRADIAVPFVHTVKAAKEGGLSAAARPDQPCDDAASEVETYFFERLKVTVPKI